MNETPTSVDLDRFPLDLGESTIPFWPIALGMDCDTEEPFICGYVKRPTKITTYLLGDTLDLDETGHVPGLFLDCIDTGMGEIYFVWVELRLATES